MRFIFLSLIIFLSACDAPLTNHVPKVETARLENGMEIIVIPDHRASVITHMLWYRVGSVDEPQGKSGIAHFFEHLMFRGTKTDPEGLFSKNVARAGGRDNAFTSYDFTAYFQRIASDKLGLMMTQEADRMHNLIVNAERVAIERKVILEERALRVDSDPSAILNERLYAALFSGTAYGVPVIGKQSEIAALAAEDALAFYQRHYRPRNAALIVAGDTTLKEVLALAQDTYGKIENTAIPQDTEPPFPLMAEAYPATSPITLEDERVQQKIWRRIYRLPPLLNNAKDSAAFDMLAEILGGGYRARLHQRLVIEEAQATQIYVGADSLRRGHGILYMQANLTPEAEFHNVRNSIDDTLTALINDGIESDILEEVRFSLLADAIYARDSQHSLAYIYGQAAALGKTPDDVAQWFTHIENMDAADIIRVAKFLRPDNYAEGYLSGNTQ